jgi:cysteinyl-tRNA synthetase, unknown class
MRRSSGICLSIVASTFLLAGCSLSNPNRSDYKQDMRTFVQGISAFAKAVDTNFIVIPQNGQNLVTLTGESNAPAAIEYLSAIDGQGREDLFYGYVNDNQPTPVTERNYMAAFLDTCERYGVQALTTDYCSTPSFMDSSYSWNNRAGYTSFAADHRDLNTIPAYPSTPYNANSANITSLSDVKNFLYILDPTQFGSKTAYLNALRASSYDAFIIDLFYDGNDSLTHDEVASLKTKPQGGPRLVICYMSIGEAESYRYYWQSNWKPGTPSFLDEENPDWAGNYKVRYWDAAWQNIIFGNDQSYLKKILDAGFDGAYLDIIDAFEYFEENY